jgi:hypothetical protein
MTSFRQIEAKLLVPQLLDREFELLDQQGPRVGFRFRGQPGRLLGAASPSA